MAIVGNVKRRPDLDHNAETQSGTRGYKALHRHTFTRVYEIPVGKTLADVDMEEGDVLPDTGEEIVISTIEKDPKNHMVNIVRCTAIKFGDWSD